jgi:Spy/CpxP family protein refolding chaperone
MRESIHIEMRATKTKGNTMKTSAIILALALGVPGFALMAQEQGGTPAEVGPGGFHLIPPPVQQQLNLTADQQKQLADLQAEVKAKVEALLTPEQLQQLQQVRPPRRGPGGPAGAGRGPGAMGRQPPVNPIIETLDLNHDGIIGVDEMAAAGEALKKLDKNGDGQLTPDEFRPPRPEGAGGFGFGGGRGRRGPGGPPNPGEGPAQPPPAEQ